MMLRFIVVLLLVGVIAYYLGFRRGARNKSNIEIDVTPAPDGQKPPGDVSK
jgi:hypothetical protein